MPTQLRRIAVAAMAFLLTATLAAANTLKAHYDIPAQSLSGALKALAQAADIQLIYNPDTVTDIQTKPLKGEYTAQEALEQLLANTPLTYTHDGRDTIVVKKKETLTSAASSMLQVAQAGSDPADGTPTQTFGNEGPTASTKKPDDSQEIVVTGTNIRGSTVDSSPVTVYSKEDISRSGAATVDQFLRTSPQNFAAAYPNTRPLAGSASPGGFAQAGANLYQGSSINLHGLGTEATLTLVNGHRMSPAGQSGDMIDISMIPLSAVERIEIMSDAASAVYGADAVAGVVNIILKSQYDGAETSAGFSSSSQGGATQLTGAQTLGTSWGSGNALMVYEYDRQDSLKANERAITQNLNPDTTVVPGSRRNSVFLNGGQSLTDRTKIEADGFISRRKSDSDAFTSNVRTHSDLENKQYGGTVGLRQRLFASWEGRLSASAYLTDQTKISTSRNVTTTTVTNFRLTSLNLGADGTVLSTSRGDIRAAFGGETRRESIDDTVNLSRQNSGSGKFERTVDSVYAELSVPLIGESNRHVALRRLEWTVSGRYDRYDDFGGALSPKVGILWEPIGGLKFRSTYGRAYRPPSLTQLAPSPQYFTLLLPNSLSSTGSTDTLIDQSGGNIGLQEQTAKSFTAGIDFTPPAIPGLSLNLTYFRVDYRDRIATPPLAGSINNVFNQLDVLAPYLNLQPGLAQVQDYFARAGFVGDLAGGGAGAVRAIFDNRPTNIAKSIQDGFDAFARYSLNSDVGDFSIAFGASYLLSLDYQTGIDRPTVSLLAIYGEPPKFKGNAIFGWARNGLNSTLTINYLDAYRNPFFTPRPVIGSWTTVGLQIGYDFGESGSSWPLRDFSIRLTAQNLFDRSPPRVVIPPQPAFGDAGFDPANASPMGRTIGLQASKHW